MTCTAPPELDELQLAEYIDGTADGAVNDHVQRCPHCAARAGQTGRWQTRLQHSLWRATCPPSLELGEYHLGFATGTRAVAIARHIIECPHCALEVSQLRGFLRAVSDGEQPARQGAGEALKDYLGGLVNVLTGTVAGGMRPAAVGIRGALREPLLVEAGEVHIMLDVQPGASGRGTLSGQILSEDVEHWVGAQIELWQRGQPARLTVVDEVGTFTFDGILAGSSELLLIAPVGEAIHIPAVNIVY